MFSLSLSLRKKAMVNAAKKGIPPDPQKGKNALFRSLHNNYFYVTGIVCDGEQSFSQHVR